MKKAILIIASICFIFSCKKQNPTPNNPSSNQVELMSYKLNGVVYNVNAASIIKDIGFGNGYFGFYIGEKVRNLYIDTDIKDSFVTNSNYNTANVAIQLGFIDNNPNRTVDTFFDFSTFKITYQDNIWIEGEFSAKDCKVRNLNSNQTQAIQVVLTDGKFKLKK